ncbi:hypothetical protein [Escherichia coli]|uniref:hypothetical protein n=1 Tax=Escherichia coli TaxID=562 RepID=UPI0039A4792F
MVGQEQLESSPLCQHSDNETETKRECSVVIPDDWQLTSQQQAGNDSNLLIVFYVQIMPDDFVMQLHRF